MFKIVSCVHLNNSLQSQNKRKISSFNIIHTTYGTVKVTAQLSFPGLQQSVTRIIFNHYRQAPDFHISKKEWEGRFDLFFAPWKVACDSNASWRSKNYDSWKAMGESKSDSEGWYEHKNFLYVTFFSIFKC